MAALASEPEKTDLPMASDQPNPTVADIETALNRGNRKLAVKLRCSIDDCTGTESTSTQVKALGTEGLITKLTAFNCWQALREDTPSWADDLMRARLLTVAHFAYIFAYTPILIRLYIGAPC